MTWLEREVLPGHLTLEPLLHRPVLFDVDDAIWLLSPGHERATRAVARRAACVVAGNDFLADWFGLDRPCRRAGVDGDRHRALHARAAPRRALRGGVDGFGLEHCDTCAPSLPQSARFLSEAADARLVVMADAFVDLPDIPHDRVDLVPWSPGREAEVVRNSTSA